MFLFVVAAAAVVIAVLWMDRRHAGDFRLRMTELHQERSRFWRARLQAGESGADAVELAVRAQGHLSRVRALADAVRTRHRDAAAATWIADVEFTRELREMEDSLTRSDWSREAAARRMEHARREVAALGRPGGGAAERVAVVHGIAGAVLGACLGFMIPFRFARGFFLEDSAAPLVTWAVGGAVLGFVLGSLGREAFWTHVLPAERQGHSLARLVVPAVAGVVLVVAAYAFWFGPPSKGQQERVMRRMIAASACPRPLPRTQLDSLTSLPAQERCAIVWTAARALPPTPDARRFAERGDTAGVVVLSMDELHASNTIHLIPGWAFEGRSKHGWRVTLGVPGRTGGIYTIFVDQRTGRGIVRQQSTRSP